jgi:hypothetical protein
VGGEAVKTGGVGRKYYAAGGSGRVRAPGQRRVGAGLGALPVHQARAGGGCWRRRRMDLLLGARPRAGGSLSI